MPDIELLHPCLRMTPTLQGTAPRRRRWPRAEPTQQEVATTRPRPSLRRYRPLMPGANPITRAVTVAILRQHGLLR